MTIAFIRTSRLMKFPFYLNVQPLEKVLLGVTTCVRLWLEFKVVQNNIAFNKQIHLLYLYSHLQQ